MKKGVTLVATILLMGFVAYGQTESENKLDAAKKAYILSRLCTEVKYNFVFYNKLDFDWDKLCMDSMPTLVTTSSDEEFVKGLQKLCVQLRDGHTEIFELDNPSNQEDWIRPFPFKTKRIGNRVFVTEVYSSDFQKQGVTINSEILEIDGEKVLDYGKKYLQPYLSSSTPQWSEFRPYSEFELTKAKGSKVSKIVFRNPNGDILSIKSNRNIEWDLQNNNNRPAMSFRMLDGEVGLLTIESFQDSDFDRELFDKLYQEVLKSKALIIDVRNNAGGNSSHADYLISHFSSKPIRLGMWRSPMYIAAHASWGYPQEWYAESPYPISPIRGKEIYQKPIALLVNAATYSSAENLCVTFRSADIGKIIGTPTGGSTGNPIFIDLGFGIGCCICTRHEVDADGNEFIGIGIQPDIVVEEDANLVLKGRDNVIETAMEYLAGRD